MIKVRLALGLWIAFCIIFLYSPNGGCAAITKPLGDVVAHAWHTNADHDVTISTYGYLKYFHGEVICEDIDAVWLWDCLRVRRYRGATHPEEAFLALEGKLVSGGLTHASIDLIGVGLVVNQLPSVSQIFYYNDTGQCNELGASNKEGGGRFSPLRYIARGQLDLDGSKVWVGGYIFSHKDVYFLCPSRSGSFVKRDENANAIALTSGCTRLCRTSDIKIKNFDGAVLVNAVVRVRDIAILDIIEINYGIPDRWKWQSRGKVLRTRSENYMRREK